MGGGGGEEGFLLLAGGAEGGGGGGASSSSEEMLMTSQGKLLAAEDEEGPGPKRVRRGRSGGFGRPESGWQITRQFTTLYFLQFHTIGATPKH